jgi:hypothetical protein
VPDARARHEVAGEHLAAPDGAVRTQARAVEDRAHGRARFPVLGQAGGEMRVVVLDRDGLGPSRPSA